MADKPFYNLDPITHETKDILYTEKGYLDKLYKFLTSSIEPPYSLSISGSWGSGKTTLMKELEEKLEKNGYPVLWFNPWEYEQVDNITLCFLIELYNFVKHRSRLKGAFKEFGIFSLTLLVSGIDVIARLLTKDKVSYKNVGEIYDDVEKALKESYETERNLVEIIKKDFAKITQQISSSYDNKPLIVFFDDLDRCLPEKALDLLEALKNFFIVKDAQVIFISGIDTDVAKQFITKRYEGLDTTFTYNYFKKIFNFTVTIPVLTERSFKMLIAQRLKELWGLSAEERDNRAGYFSTLLVKAGVKSIRQAYNVLHNCYFILNMNPELEPKYKEYLVLSTTKECKPEFFEKCCKLANKNPDGRFFAEIQTSEQLEQELQNPFLAALIEELKEENPNLRNQELLGI